MLKKRLITYINGNYEVTIYDDGTKLRYCVADELIPEFPESIDLKITDCCDCNCPMCHENSTPNGAHASLSEPLLESLKKGMEVAIGGGNPLTHPKLELFLNGLKDKGVIANMTVNQAHFTANKSRIKRLMSEKLIYGLGISYTGYDENIIQFCQENTNTVLHIIAGYHTLADIEQLFDKGIKVLFLGYKRVGRGAEFYSQTVEQEISRLKSAMPSLRTHFPYIAFDNLALTQLLNESDYITRPVYMGADGQFTLYVDAVAQTFSLSSSHSGKTPYKNETITEVFKALQMQL